MGGLFAPLPTVCQNLLVPRFATATASYRENTEDRAMVLPVQAGWIVCIADGTGGISGGAAAAELFITGVRRAALQSRFDLADPATWATLVEALDDEIAAEPHAGETTGIALAITSGLVVGASCGDSRAWLSTRTGWQDLTSRQSRRPTTSPWWWDGSIDATPSLLRQSTLESVQRDLQLRISGSHSFNGRAKFVRRVVITSY